MSDGQTLSKDQRSIAAGELAEIQGPREGVGRASEHNAKAADISKNRVDRARRLLKVSPPLAEAVRSGDMSLIDAEKVSHMEVLVTMIDKGYDGKLSDLVPDFHPQTATQAKKAQWWQGWLAESGADDDPESADDHDDEGDEPGSTREPLAIALEEAAEDLLFDVKFLNDIVELLEDKGQVILYGPPGTGKTYLAQRLAEALSPDTDARTLVQFHPAYSYEDFFEGYRPAVDDHGNMTYRLTAGPLMKIAESARANSGQRHVMVIDEINRANLPRVVGELLFLLEYRDRVIHTQYRPEEQFSLPENLWFIGTMNTADRSIALIDAAMRRRFHFVPFFPNRPPTQGLLRRWTQKHAPSQAPIADLLKEINSELEQALGGDHLLIGPSHFMKRDLDTEGLRRIWEYNIEPLIEDQLFGQQEVINRFRFDAVWNRHGPGATSSGTEPESSDEPAGDVGQTSHDDGDIDSQVGE